MKALYKVSPKDNVATALEDLSVGDALVIGSCDMHIQLSQAIPFGHKAAVSAIQAGSPIIKYGIVIAIANDNIQPGEYVHIHNCSSPSDHRTEHFDESTGQPDDMRYIRLEDVYGCI